MAKDYFSQFEDAPQTESNYDWGQFDSAEQEMGLQPETNARKKGRSKDKSKSKSSIIKDVVTGAIDVLPTLGQNIAGLRHAPSELKGALENGPGRFGQNITAGLGKLGRSILNVPGNAVDYLKEKDVVPDWVQSWRPSEEFNDYDYARGVGLNDVRPGDALTQGLAENSLTGLAAGYGALPAMAASGIKAIGENENPITAALTSGAELGIAKGIGKGIQKLPAAIKKVPGAIESVSEQARSVKTALSPEKIANNVIKAEKAAVTTNTEMFDKVLEQASKKNIKIETPTINTKQLKSGLAKDELKSLNKALETRSAVDAHRAQSDLGMAQRRLLKKKSGPVGLTSQEVDTLKAVVQAKNKLLKSVDKSLVEHGGKRMAQDYANARIDFKKNVLPYEKNKNLGKYKANEMEPGTLAKKLAQDEKFMRAVGKQNHPELKTRRNIIGAGKVLGLGVGGSMIKDYLFGGNK